MKYIPTLIALLLFARVSVASEQMKGLHRFYADYAVVQHSLKNDKGLFNQLMALYDLDRNVANFLAEFWWTKAKKECDSFVKEAAEHYSRMITAETSQPERERLEKEVKQEADHCFYGVYYEHWDEINQMISQRYKERLKKRKNE